MSLTSCLPRAFHVGFAAFLLAGAIAAPAEAASCGKGAGGFGGWLAGFKRQAAAAGVSQRAIAQGLEGVTYDARIIHFDRNQKSLKL
jgi:membrane-bound lytic murein transglycosylase B